MKHFPELKTCQNLKEVGFPQETRFEWLHLRGNDWVCDFEHVPWFPVDYRCSAPLLTEILEQLPAGIESEDKKYLEILKNDDGSWYIFIGVS